MKWTFPGIRGSFGARRAFLAGLALALAPLAIPPQAQEAAEIASAAQASAPSSARQIQPLTGRFLDQAPEGATGPGHWEALGLFQDLPATSTLAGLSLRRCVEMTLELNPTLVNARRDVEISRSSLRESEAFFIPYVDLVSAASYQETRRDTLTAETSSGAPELVRDRIRMTQNRQSGGVEAGQNLPTGGQIRVSAETARERGLAGSGPQGGSVAYENTAQLRLSQPLLRGAGFDVGTADLRSARLSQIGQDIQYRLQIRDATLETIQQYFSLLQAAQDLRVSRDALAEKLRFLEETRVKFEKGRVAESEILRAELLYLQEQESEVSRRRTFDARLDQLVLTLGLDPGTAVSVEDVTEALARRGRFEIPDLDEAIRLGLSNRLELLQNELSVEQSRISLTIARNALLPDLGLTTGFVTSDEDRSIGGSTDLEDNTWDAGVELRIPLQNIARRERFKRSKLSYEKALTNLRDRERRITQEIKSAYRSVQSAERSLDILEVTVEQARRTLELVNGQFEVGFVTIVDVRNAQDDLFQAQTRFNNTLLNYQVLIAQFYVAIGQPLV